MLRKAESGTAGHMEQRAQITHPSAQAALPVWLNYVHQQACTPEAWNNRRAWLDGVGKGYTLLPFPITFHCRFVSKWKHRHGQAQVVRSQVHFRGVRAVRVYQLVCDCFRPTVLLMNLCSAVLPGSVFIKRATPAKADILKIHLSLAHVEVKEDSL